jgi:hypothetical protein
LKDAPIYIRISHSQLFTNRELHLQVLAWIDDIVSFAADFNTALMPYGDKYCIIFKLCR